MAVVFPLSKDWACVTIKRIAGRKYQLLTGINNIGLLSEGTKMIDFEGSLFDDEGNELHADGKFYRTAETIDPYHLLVDMF